MKKGLKLRSEKLRIRVFARLFEMMLRDDPPWEVQGNECILTTRIYPFSGGLGMWRSCQNASKTNFKDLGEILNPLLQKSWKLDFWGWFVQGCPQKSNFHDIFYSGGRGRGSIFEGSILRNAPQSHENLTFGGGL